MELEQVSIGIESAGWDSDTPIILKIGDDTRLVYGQTTTYSVYTDLWDEIEEIWYTVQETYTKSELIIPMP